MKHRLIWSTAGFQFVYFYATNYGIVRFADRGASIGTEYPFSRYRRLGLSLQYLNIAQDNLTYSFLQSTNTSVLMPTLSYTKDNTIWGLFAPGSGNRSYVELSGSPKVGKDGKQFVTGDFDLRHYLSITKDYYLALRLAGGASFGPNPTLFILGGVDNWLNYRYYNRISYLSIQDYFLSDFLTPLRGSDLYELVGTRAALLNAEFRFPFIQYLITRFPLPLGLQSIEGLTFLDAGSAWTNDKSWRFLGKKSDGSTYVQDITTGFGYGLRIYIYITVLKFDAAWRTDFNHVSSPRYYWSIGLNF